jgi:hypothetical protein
MMEHLAGYPPAKTGGLNAKDEEKRLRSRALSQMLTTVTPALLGSGWMSSNFGNMCSDHKPDLPLYTHHILLQARL